MVSNIGTIKYDIINKSQTVFSDKYFNNIDFVSGLIKNNENYYFTSNKGIVSIFNSNEHKKKCSDLKIKRFSVSGKSRILDSVIQISHKNFPIEIEYHSVSLKDKIYYQYKLKDFDENWSNPTLQSSASFSNLPAGKYTFLVKTVSILNNTTIDENNISFIINIPFWKTQKFIYLTVAIIASVVLFFYFNQKLTFFIICFKFLRLAYVAFTKGRMLQQLSEPVPISFRGIHGMI